MTLEELKYLAGIGQGVYGNSTTPTGQGSNPSITAAEKVALQKKHNIKPGSDEYIKLWFSKPYLTGEKPI